MLGELGLTVLTENEVSCWSLILKFILFCQKKNSQLVFSAGNNREVQVLSDVLVQLYI